VTGAEVCRALLRRSSIPRQRGPAGPAKRVCPRGNASLILSRILLQWILGRRGHTLAAPRGRSLPLNTAHWNGCFPAICWVLPGRLLIEWDASRPRAPAANAGRSRALCHVRTLLRDCWRTYLIHPGRLAIRA